jgi:hypothetical protein
MFRKITLLMALILILSINLYGGSKEEIGTTTATFLKLSVGAKASALNGAFVAVCDDSTAIYYNAAGLIQVKKEELHMMYNQHFQDITHGFISYANPLKGGKTVLGFAITALGVNEIEVRTKDTLEPERESQILDICLSMGIAKKLTKQISLGLNLKAVRSKIVDVESKAYAGDVGILLRMKNLSLGLCAQNIVFKKMKFHQIEENLPSAYIAGASIRLMKNNLLISYEAVSPIDNEIHHHLGVELKIREISLRIGYGNGVKDIGRKMTAGVGISFDTLTFDYCFDPYGLLGDTHKISVTMRI